MTAVFTDTQYDAIFDKMDEFDEAYDKGDIEGALAIGRSIEYPPHLLMRVKKVLGKDYLIENGFNLKLADEAFGKDWLDEP